MSVLHEIAPVADARSRVLILGSFPSVKSRESGFFYGHPQNRFWRTLAAVLDEDVPTTPEEKRKFLLRNHIAVWDVVAECEIAGSSDSTIKNVIPNEIDRILRIAPIEQIFANGTTAYRLYCRYLQKRTDRAAICLPSTSPANATWSQERLIEAWQSVGRILKGD